MVTLLGAVKNEVLYELGAKDLSGAAAQVISGETAVPLRQAVAARSVLCRSCACDALLCCCSNLVRRLLHWDSQLQISLTAKYRSVCKCVKVRIRRRGPLDPASFGSVRLFRLLLRLESLLSAFATRNCDIPEALAT